MRLRQATRRMRPSLLAVAAGWAAAIAATMPMQWVKIIADAYGGLAVLLLSLSQGTLIWGVWSLAIAAGGWLFGLVPVILFVPESWLLGHRRKSIAIAAILGWTVVLAKFEIWKLVLPYHTLALRMFVLYSLLLTVFAAVSAAVYLRLIKGTSETASVNLKQ
jgi:hypothetical protein